MSLAGPMVSVNLVRIHMSGKSTILTPSSGCIQLGIVATPAGKVYLPNDTYLWLLGLCPTWRSPFLPCDRRPLERHAPRKQSATGIAKILRWPAAPSALPSSPPPRDTFHSRYLVLRPR